ncbi:MAG TPA: GntR family transcriptional regulator [Acidobacteriaceae bacterium]|jgi:DNA-binding GntR family transcriptional regulator|nr:GntR family transcriptional regulator [Acidobacteriaceae bacterium]
MVNLPQVLKAPNLTELAYLSVKKHLLNGSLEEGQRLTEESLASQLGMSKSPVREALNRLESEGLVCIEARRGAFVRRFSAKETRDLFDTREVLEVHALSIAHITPQLLQDLSESLARTTHYVQQGNKLAHVEEDVSFHVLIARATGNNELCRILENIHQKSLLSRSRSYHLSASRAPLSHRNIYVALREGDRAAAQHAMREHIIFVRDSLLSSFTTRGQDAAPVPPADGSPS